MSILEKYNTKSLVFKGFWELCYFFIKKKLEEKK